MSETMSETNGTAPEAKRILSLESARATKTRKGNDFITVQQAYDMVIQECAKVHEHYLTQIPTFVARMVQDALLSYGLIVPQPGADIAPVAPAEATVPSAESPETRESIAPSPDAHDSIQPAEPAA